MQQIDINSDEFQAELEKTWYFVEKVNAQFGFVQNPNTEVNEGVAMGLARNKLRYGKRFCPCFMVIGETKEEQKKADNRICPCKPALEKEIPEDGLCHCGIFCTPAYAASQAEHDVIEETVHTHSKGLNQEQAQTLLEEEQLDGDELGSYRGKKLRHDYLYTCRYKRVYGVSNGTYCRNRRTCAYFTILC